MITFPEDFVIPENWKSINKGKRNLFEQQAMEIVVSPVGTQTKEDVAFDWQIYSFTETDMKIAMEFTNPYAIS